MFVGTAWGHRSKNPVVFRAINEARNTDKSLMEIYHDAINMANEKRVI